MAGGKSKKNKVKKDKKKSKGGMGGLFACLGGCGGKVPRDEMMDEITELDFRHSSLTEVSYSDFARHKLQEINVTKKNISYIS